MSKHTRSKANFFEPAGEILKGSRPPTIYELVKYKNFLKANEVDQSDNWILNKRIVPELKGIWQKVHPAIPLKSDLSISNHLYQIH